MPDYKHLTVKSVIVWKNVIEVTLYPSNETCEHYEDDEKYSPPKRITSIKGFKRVVPPKIVTEVDSSTLAWGDLSIGGITFKKMVKVKMGNYGPFVSFSGKMGKGGWKENIAASNDDMFLLKNLVMTAYLLGNHTGIERTWKNSDDLGQMADKFADVKKHLPRR